MHYCKKYADVMYSLYFLTEDADSSDFFKWLDDEYFLNDVSRFAQKVYWRESIWYTRSCEAALLDLTDPQICSP